MVDSSASIWEGSPPVAHYEMEDIARNGDKQVLLSHPRDDGVQDRMMPTDYPGPKRKTEISAINESSAIFILKSRPRVQKPAAPLLDYGI